VLVGVEVGVRVGRGVRVGVRVGVSVGSGVMVGVGVTVGVGVVTGVEVKVGWRVLIISSVGVGSSVIATNLSNGEAKVQAVVSSRTRKTGRMESWKVGKNLIFQPSSLLTC
jgi:Zn-dependent alcohol dehydrogenase